MIASCETETKVFSYDDWPACYQERYSLLSHILWGILLNESRQVYVAIVSELAGYFDDGGHPDDQVAVLVAGFVASKEQWLAFDVELAEVLASYGISSAFHRTDFEKGIGPFNLKPKRKRVLLETLLGVIRRHTLSSFSESVLMNDYRKLNDSHLFEEFIGTPYALVGRSLAAKLNPWKTKYAPDSRLLLFFEDGTKHKGDFMEAMQRDGLPCPVFLKKMEATPLQASDILAWEIFSAIKSGARRTGRYRDSLITLLGSSLSSSEYHGVYQVQELLGLCESQALPKRDSVPPGAHVAYRTSPRRRRRRTIGRAKQE